jgi:tRNA(Ile)-lysidine synthase
MNLAAEVVAFLASLRPPAAAVTVLDPEDKLVIGVSGGPDSLVLLHLLAQQRLHPLDRLFAAHLNHNLRPEADVEAAYVTDLAAGWGVASLAKHRDVAAYARAEGLSLEEAGRLARYQFLGEVADTVGASVVATAHHAGDQAESVMMHLLRGTGLDGLRGMLPVGHVPGRPDLALIRPFLQVDRAAIAEYIAVEGLSPVVDESNQETTFYRNWLRHDLLPLLDKRNPGLPARLRQLAELARADVDLLEELAAAAWETALVEHGEQWLALDRRYWAARPLSLRRRLIRRAVLAIIPEARDVAFRTVEQARMSAEQAGSGGAATLPAGIVMKVDADRLLFRSAAGEGDNYRRPQLANSQALALAVPGQVRLGGEWLLEAGPADPTTLGFAAANKDPWTAVVSVPEDARLVVRPRLRGERFRPLGLGGRHALVSEVMINRKIPARWRGRWPIVATEKHLIWLVGHQLDERARVTSETQKGIVLRVIRLAGG